MNQENKFKIPMHMIILDVIGSVLAALGILEWFTPLSLVPEPFKFEYYYIAMVVIGVAMMIPMHLHIFSMAFSKTNQQQ